MKIEGQLFVKRKLKGRKRGRVRQHHKSSICSKKKHTHTQCKHPSEILQIKKEHDPNKQNKNTQKIQEQIFEELSYERQNSGVKTQLKLAHQ